MSQGLTPRRILAGLAVAVAPALIALGCGGTAGGNATTAKPAEEHGKRAREMDDFMKGGGKNQSPAK
jgi:hypothetical protein